MDDFLWWRDGVIYQVYLRSFADGNGDGLGDLPGLISHLDYLADLGVDAIWLSPIQPSPDKDFGYDVSDYCQVDPRYGSLADFDRLVAEAHQRGIHIILDMVMNHTSDQHEWFKESRSSRNNPKRDWYIWRPPSGSPHLLRKWRHQPPSGSPHFLRKWGESKKRVPTFEGRKDASSRTDVQKWGERKREQSKRRAPNNWQAAFGGKAWEYDKITGQYYLHLFTKEQPDVNWRNPEVRQAQLDVFRFWLERGVDGFRLDVFNAYFKHPDLPDNPPKFGVRGFDRQHHIYDMDQPDMLPLLKELRLLLDAYPERYAVGETYLVTPQKAFSYCGPDKLQAAFSFDFTTFRSTLAEALQLYLWDPNWIMQKIRLREEVCNQAGIWPTTVMSNHDLPRAASRYARGEDDAQAKIAMALLLTLRGTPFMYYGEEIGMRDIHLQRSGILDPAGKPYWPIYKGRDGCRSPMQWDDSSYAGFSTAKPWLLVNPDYNHRNVLAQQANLDSLFHFTKKLLSLRREYPALQHGDFIPLEARPGTLAYLRTTQEQSVLVAINITGRTVKSGQASRRNTPPDGKWEMLFSSNRDATSATSRLSPYEVRLLLRTGE
jgi:alpha-glucosidase